MDDVVFGWFFANKCTPKTIEHPFDKEFPLNGKGEHQANVVCMMGKGGGKFCVPRQYYREFLEQYAKAIKRKEILTFCETSFTIFNLYGDFDFTCKEKKSDKYIFTLVRLFQDTVKKFYPNESSSSNFFDMAVYLSISDKNGKMKYGIHPYFRIISNAEIALTIREYLLHELEKNYKRDLDEDPWSDVLDPDVYLNGTLRLPFSYKGIPCEICKKKKKEHHYCENGKKLREFSYTPFWYISGTGVIDQSKTSKMKKDIITAVLWGSIGDTASDHITPGFEIPPNAPKPDMNLMTKKGKKKKPTILSDGPKQLPTPTKTKEFLPVNDKRAELIIQKINKMHENWKELRIESIAINPNKKTYYNLIPAGLGQHYCFNKRDKHGKARISFYITIGGISQKCGCRKGRIGYANVKCTEYTSTPLRCFTDKDKELLFPDLYYDQQLKKKRYKNPQDRPEQSSNVIEDTQNFLRKRLLKLSSPQNPQKKKPRTEKETPEK